MPPKKATKMSLNDFLADASTGSWADEATQIPTTSIASYEEPTSTSGGSRPPRAPRESSSSRTSGRDRYPAREQKPLPTEPPFIAFMGNMPMSCSEKEVEDLVKDLKVTSIRLIRERDDGHFKGFGYVEFEDLDSLKTALGFAGMDFHGRTLKVDVADSPSGGRGGRSPRRDEDERYGRSWRRDEPLGASRGGDRPPRREREEPQIDLGSWRRGEKPAAAPTPKANWEARGPRPDRKFEDRPPRERREFSSERPPRKPRKGEKSEEDVKAMEAKIAAMRFGNK